MLDPSKLRPMLATLAASDPPLVDPALVYEPKYDGIRAIVLVAPQAPGMVQVKLWSRLGNEKTRQFPEVVGALEEWGRALSSPVVLDGEIVALDGKGQPAGFQRLQNRIHIQTPGFRSSKPQLRPDEQPTALIVFDLLFYGGIDRRGEPLRTRRAELEGLLARFAPPAAQMRISEQVAGDGRLLFERAAAEGWEGLLVKAAQSPYRTGRRSPEWRKLKILKQDEFVVGGWTEPKGTRAKFGSLVLGTYRDGTLVHAGDVGTGFSGAELDRLWALLAPLATDTSPFVSKPKTLGRAHWVKPVLVAQVRFSEWTDDGRLRHPAYLGLRDDKRASEVRTPVGGGQSLAERRAVTVLGPQAAVSGSGRSKDRPLRTKPVAMPAAVVRRGRSLGPPVTAPPSHVDELIRQIAALEERRRSGKIHLADGDTLDITNPHKVFWPDPPFTKGDLLRYYARIAPYILPVVADRALVMKRMPNGVRGEAFYQHRAPEPVPPGVRAATLPNDDVPARLIGGTLKTLLYMAQIASISMDPWFSRVDAGDHADQVAIDLDPQPGTSFRVILDVARWVHDELQTLGVHGYPKTSGSEGLHIFIPLRPGTTYEAGLLFCQIVATLVSTRHPKVATIERAVRKRPSGTVYVDYLQNIEGKTLACAYSARASAFGGVSAPLTWKEVYDRPQPQDFTIGNMLDRVARVGDLWEAMREDPGADLPEAIERLKG